MTLHWHTDNSNSIGTLEKIHRTNATHKEWDFGLQTIKLN